MGRTAPVVADAGSAADPVRVQEVNAAPALIGEHLSSIRRCSDAQRFTQEEMERVWDMHQAGVPVKRIARTLGRQNVSLRKLISGSGGIRPRARVVNDRHLGLEEREEISRAWPPGCRCA